MPLIDSTKADLSNLTANQIYWLYNGLDCAVTHELKLELDSIIDQDAKRVYNLERSLQAPALEMMRRGVLINPKKRTLWIEKYRKKQGRVGDIVQQYARAIWDKPLNPNSPKQLQEILYNTMGLPVQYSYSKATGKSTPSTDVNALGKLKLYFYAIPLINAVLKFRELGKMISTLEQGVDPDGRFRASFNVAGTDTGRWSSSTNVFGRGSNLQNITNQLREIIIADKGKKYAYIDLEQAESNIVSRKSGDKNYIKAHDTGDPHTYVARLIWPDLPWTGDLKKDRAICDDHNNPFYRHFTYRDMSKKGQHGTNYYGTPRTMAMHLKVPVNMIESFQEIYFSPENFPGIADWHTWVAKEIQTKGSLATAFHRKRTFFGRLREDETLRKAIAYEPQSTVGDYLNTGLLRVWREYTLTENLPTVQLLIQLHDAILVQYNEELEDVVIPRIRKLLTFPISVLGIDGVLRTTQIKTDVVVGWNWAYASDKNPDGLKKWRGKDQRKRTEIPKLR